MHQRKVSPHHNRRWNTYMACSLLSLFPCKEIQMPCKLRYFYLLGNITPPPPSPVFSPLRVCNVCVCVFCLKQYEAFIVGECENKQSNEDCNGWEKSGFCKKSSKWYGFMKKNCQKSCGFCESKGTVQVF